MLIHQYPFNPERFKLSSGYELSYISLNAERGDHETSPIVMLHGNPTWSYYYRHVLQYFKATHQVVAIDHLGMGLSDKPQKYHYSLVNHIHNVIEILDHLNIKKATFIMHDWGGAIGHGVALKRPDLVGAMVSMNTAAFLSKRIPWRIALCKIPFLGEWLVRTFNAFALPATFMAVKKKLSKEVRHSYLLPYNNYQNRIATARFVQDIPLHPSHPTYSTLQEIEKGLPRLNSLPKIFIWGEKDFCFTPHFLYRFTQIFPNAKSTIFPDAGHYLLEDKRDEVIKVIEEFLNEYRR